MIDGKAIAIFGTGTVEMTVFYESEDVSVLCLKTVNPHSIGSVELVPDEWDPNSAQILMRFTCTESVDALISELIRVKQVINNDPAIEYGKHVKAIDYDRFLSSAEMHS